MIISTKWLFPLSGGVAILLTSILIAKPGTDSLLVELCDGETTLEIGAGPKSSMEGRAIAGQLMGLWLEKNPDQSWEMGMSPPEATQDPQRDPDEIIERRHTIVPPFDNSYLLGDGQSDDHVYGILTKRDLMVWEQTTKKLVIEGARVFHNAQLLGSTIAVSCDMCHPDASNTHPETYPKFQTQLGDVALLRDMINWCLQHPVRAEKMLADDPRMRALEAYIYAQRKGSELQYGKH